MVFSERRRFKAGAWRVDSRWSRQTHDQAAMAAIAGFEPKNGPLGR